MSIIPQKSKTKIIPLGAQHFQLYYLLMTYTVSINRGSKILSTDRRNFFFPVN